jgi:hypothetical protein
MTLIFEHRVGFLSSSLKGFQTQTSDVGLLLFLSPLALRCSLSCGRLGEYEASNWWLACWGPADEQELAKIVDVVVLLSNEKYPYS